MTSGGAFENTRNDLFTEYPVAELIHFTVALPEEVVAEISNALEGFRIVRGVEDFITLAIEFTLADIRHNDAAVLDSLCMADRSGIAERPGSDEDI